MPDGRPPPLLLHDGPRGGPTDAGCAAQAKQRAERRPARLSRCIKRRPESGMLGLAFPNRHSALHGKSEFPILGDPNRSVLLEGVKLYLQLSSGTVPFLTLPRPLDGGGAAPAPACFTPDCCLFARELGRVQSVGRKRSVRWGSAILSRVDFSHSAAPTIGRMNSLMGA